MSPTNKSEKHFMVDLETLGTTAGCVLLSIGCATVEYTNGDWGVHSTFYHRINLKSSLDEGFAIDADTIMWWLKQDEDARKSIYDNEGLDVCFVLSAFNEWVKASELDIDNRMLWGNGATFDIGIFMKAYRMTGYSEKQLPFIQDKNNRCYRTLKNVFSHVPKPDKTGTAHHALDDALWQAHHLAAILNTIDTMAELSQP